MYRGLALVEYDKCSRKYLFEMPEMARIEKGDEVVVDTVNGEKRARVVSTVSYINDDSEEFKMIGELAGGTNPLRRIIKKVTYNELRYEDDDE